MITLTPYVGFAGDAAEALAFHASVFGGTTRNDITQKEA